MFYFLLQLGVRWFKKEEMAYDIMATFTLHDLSDQIQIFSDWISTTTL